MEEVTGNYDDYEDWVQDPEGYFLIRIDREKKLIEILVKREGKDDVLIRGKRPQDIYFEVAKRKLVSLLDHASYLGKELQKAYLALHHDLEYIQDEEIELK